MSATKRFHQLLGHPDFDKLINSKGRWRLYRTDGSEIAERDWEARSPFGFVRSAVVLGPDGSIIHDRPEYGESENVNSVVWGLAEDGTARIGIIRQPRPAANDPEQPGDRHDPLVFAGIPMGFRNRIFGKNEQMRYEDAEKCAIRETGEEIGARVIINTVQPTYPHIFPNPTFCSTCSDLYFVQVDLKHIERIKHDPTEPIFSVEFISVPELLSRIRDGKDEQGAIYRMGISLADLMLFFACHPEFFSANEAEKPRTKRAPRPTSRSKPPSKKGRKKS